VPTTGPPQLRHTKPARTTVLALPQPARQSHGGYAGKRGLDSPPRTKNQRKHNRQARRAALAAEGKALAQSGVAFKAAKEELAQRKAD
jgi:hypothetical protein